MSNSALQPIDVVVLTALPEEFAAVLACLTEPALVPPTAERPNTYSWHVGTIHSTVHDKVYTVIVGKGEATTTYAALGTKAAITLFRPRYVVFVGCAGGFEEGGQHHGDVAVSNNIYAYEYGKVDQGFQPRPHYHYRVDRGLVRAAEVTAQVDKEWWHPDDTGMKRPPAARVGDIASGDKVVDDPTDPIFAKVRSLWPKMLAVEMEAAGVAAAIEEALAEGTMVGFLIVRGISDMPHAKGGSEGPSTTERDTWKVTACTNAARFFAALIAHRWPVPPSLAEDPDESDWKRIANATRSSLDTVRDSLGSGIVIQRDALMARLETALATRGAVALIGPSGSGKSSVVKRAIESRLGPGHAMWVDCRTFERQDFVSFEQGLRLSKSLRDLGGATNDPFALLALDGLDHVRDKRAFQQLSGLLSAFLSSAQRRWQLLLTCQTQEFARIQLELLRASVGVQQWEIVECPPPSRKELGVVWDQVPGMELLRFQNRFRPMLANLKVLDLIVSHVLVGRDPPASTWIGESSVALWFWDNEIALGDDAAPRMKFVSTLAEREAAQFGKAPLVTDFEVAELQPLAGLIQDRICQRSQRDEILFEHDLLSDWVRFRAVLTNDSALTQFLKSRLNHPLWHRAVRLYGLYLLEHVGSTDRWRQTLEAVSRELGDSARDLLLEALFFASDSLQLLRSVSAALIETNGVLLVRMLNRFASFATVPNPRVMAFARSRGWDELEIASTHRVPIWMYWPPLLVFLHEKRTTLIPLAPREIATLVRLWLEHMPQGGEFRPEAAALAVMLGERAIAIRNKYGVDDNEARSEYYSIALIAVTDAPNEVTGLALRAAGRAESSPPTETHQKPTKVKPEDATPKGQKTSDEEEGVAPATSGGEAADPDDLEDDEGNASANEVKTLDDSAFQAPGWDGLEEPEPEDEDFGGDELPDDGPRGRVDDEFRKAVLTQAIFRVLAEARPAVAREVALGVLIRERQERRRYDVFGHDPFEHHLGLEEPRWGLDLYHQGPFLMLLRSDFSEGLRLCTGVVDLATRNWRVQGRMRRRFREASGNASRNMLLGNSGSELELEFDLDGARVFEGGPRVFGWSAGLGAAPHVATVALMALEQYLYERIDAKGNVGPALSTILSTVRSVAFVKVLVDVGKRQPLLFDGVLRPLLACVELYGLDMQVQREGRGHLMIGAVREPSEVVALAKEFHNLPHRNRDLRLLARERLFASPSTRTFLGNAVKRWRSDAASDESLRDFVDQMDALFDGNNDAYEIRKTEGGLALARKGLESQAGPAVVESDAMAGRLAMITLPARVSQLLEGKTALSDNECDVLWLDVIRVARMPTLEDEGWGTPLIEVPDPDIAGSQRSSIDEKINPVRRVVRWIRSRMPRLSRAGADTPPTSPPSGVLRLRGFQADGVIAGIAAIGCLNYQWFLREPRRLRWARSCIVATITAAGPRGPLDSDHLSATWDAETFLTVAVPCLWSHAHANHELRGLLIDLVFQRRYSTVQALFTRMAQSRATYRRTFQQLRRVALEWAHLRDLATHVEHVRQHSVVDRTAEVRPFFAAVTTWQQRARSEFVADRTPESIGPWSLLNPRQTHPDFREWDGHASKRRHKRALDMALLSASHAWIPGYDELLDKDEQADVLAFWREALASILEPVRTLGAKSERSFHDGPGTPHEIDQWILRGAAVSALHVPLVESRHYWEPIMSLPEPGHYWCESFLHEVFRAGLRNQGAQALEKLVALADTLLSAALARPIAWTWVDDVWPGLLGIDWYNEDVWEARHESVIHAMIPNIVRWTTREALYAGHLVQLAKWLQRVGGSEARTRLLPTLRDVCGRRERNPLDDERLPRALANLLAETWRHDQPELRNERLTAFHDLLRMLAERQDKVALQLLGQLGRLA